MNRLYWLNKTCDLCKRRMGAKNEHFDDHCQPSARQGIAYECRGGDGKILGQEMSISDEAFERICDRFGI